MSTTTMKITPAAAAAAVAACTLSSSTVKTFAACTTRRRRGFPLTLTATTNLFFTHNHNNHRNGFPHFRISRRRATPLGVVSMSSSSAAALSNPLEILVKASVTNPTKLGDCPFCQRILLTLEEKQLPYETKLVDLTNKPEWFLKINPDGKVPVIKLDEKWIADSDVIAQTLEEKYPEPSLATPPEKSSVGSKIFSSFIVFLKSKDPSDGTEQALLNELSSFNDYIKEIGPFINGKDISAADLSLGPKLFHLEISLGHYKNWTIPESLSHLKSYMKNVFSRDSFVKTTAAREDVVLGWGKLVT